MTKTLQHSVAITMLAGIACLALPCFAGEWQKPWSSVQDESAKKCANIFDAFQRQQAVCMEKRKGYDNMQLWNAR